MRAWLVKLAIAVAVSYIAINAIFAVLIEREADEVSARMILGDSVHLLATMRHVYRERLQSTGLVSSIAGVELCPGGVIGEMSRRSMLDHARGVSIANVSDRPRNPDNRADVEALSALAYFRTHGDASEYFSTIKFPDGRHGYQMAMPLRVETGCLMCHGPRATTLPIVQARYSEGFDYAVGDLRGVLIARIAADKLESEGLMRNRLAAAAVSALVLVALLFYFLNKFLIGRLRMLFNAFHQLGQGVYAPVPAPAGGDEITGVLRKFNDMAELIAQRERTISDHVETISRQQEFLKGVVDSLGDPVLVIDRQYRIMMQNDAARRLIAVGSHPRIEYCHSALFGLEQPCSDAVRPCPLRAALAGESKSAITYAVVSPHGETRRYEGNARPVSNAQGEVIGIVENLHDVTPFVRQENELRLSNERLNQQANCDPLTGLPNRRAIEERLEQAVDAAQSGGPGFALAFVDLDGFKAVNDTWGHLMGDDLLKAVAGRLQNAVRKSDLVGRLAGDEFVVVVPYADDHAQLERLADHILDVLRRPVALGSATLSVTASVGLARFPQDAQTLIELFRAADAAMYAAKRRGRNGAVFFACAAHRDTE